MPTLWEQTLYQGEFMTRSEQPENKSRNVDFWVTLAAFVLAILFIILATEVSHGQTFTVVHNLVGNLGTRPGSGVILDAAGNLYGTAVSDGPNECGMVFKLTNSAGGWTYSDLHDFTCRDDGEAPFGGVTLDSSGNIYGTAAYGGMFGAQCAGPDGVGCGVVWEITGVAAPSRK